MSYYPFSAKRYIKEATEALGRLKVAQNGDELQRALVHFLETSKHTMIQLQTDFTGVAPDFDEWWIAQSAILKQDRLCRFFYQLRNRVVKGGENVLAKSFHIDELTIVGGQYQINAEGVMAKYEKGDSYEWSAIKAPGTRLLWKFSDYPDGYDEVESSVLLCERYLGILESVVDDFVRRFG